jgi:hypothetical protein
MNENKINNVLIFAGAVILGALLLMLIPAFNLWGFEFKKVDVLADIRSSNNNEIDTVEIVPQIKPQFVDTCKTGVVCIEDYTVEHNGLHRFYDALEENNRQVRIAYFGDSFIEGDLLSGALRTLLQKKYGGNGVGFVPVNCITAGFRLTVRTSASGWSEHCITDHTFSRNKQGISGHYFIPTANATATFVCKDLYGKEADTCNTASFYFITDGDLKFTTTVNKTEKQQHTAHGSSNIQKVSVYGQIGHLRITVENPGKDTRFFGVTLDNDNSGVVVDNFSLRGISGETLKTIPAKILHDFDSLRNYDLIILQYGLNVATKNGKDYSSYKKAMISTVNYLRENLPASDFLLVSVGDRSTKENGEMVTMAGVKNLMEVQKNIAQECGVAFLNLIEIMALDGGMAGYVKDKPSKANSDYTHINLRGGVIIAEHLFETFEYGKEKYLEKKKLND